MRGFFAFFAALAMIAIIAIFTASTNSTLRGLENTTHELMKAEQANKERTLLENNSDKIIQTKLQEQIELKNYDTLTAKAEVNRALTEYLDKRAVAGTIFFEKISQVNEEFLNANSEVQIIKAPNAVYAQYTYASNQNKTQIIYATLGNQITTHFIIPVGYTNSVIRWESE